MTLPNAEQVLSWRNSPAQKRGRGGRGCICTPYANRWTQHGAGGRSTRYVGINWTIGDCAMHGKRAARKAAKMVACSRCGAPAGENCRLPAKPLTEEEHKAGVPVEWAKEPGPGFWVHEDRAEAWYALVPDPEAAT